MTAATVQTGNDAMMEIDRVSVTFPVRAGAFGKENVHAVELASFELRRGEVLGVVGESGCGKSTLARVLIGLQPPTHGHYRLHGEDVFGLRSAARHTLIAKTVAMVFQDPASSLNPRLNARRIVRDPLDVHKVGNALSRERRVDELMSLVGLPKSTADRLPRELSGGQRQRVAIARALALNPKIIVADEPTSALDVSVRSQIINLLMDLKSTLKLSMVFISHDMHTVRYLSDRIAVMYLGRVVELGGVEQVAHHSRHPYTRALLSATSSIGGANTERIVLQGNVPSPRHPPSGCPFHTRCWRATSECKASLPPATKEAHRSYHCFHPL